MKTQHLNRSFSFASVLALVTGLVAAPIPAQADVTEESAISDPVLQVGGDETSRNLSWMSESSGGGEIRWAKASEVDDGQLPADAQSAETTDSGLATDLRRHYNHAAMTGLEPDTEYAYQVGSEEDGYTPVENFVTGPSGGDSEFLVFGDPQIGSGGGRPDDAAGWERTLNSALATAQDPRFFYSMGDQVNIANSQSQYEQYLAPDATRTVPQATTIGNHDVASKSYEQHFNRPNVSRDHGGGGAITSGGDYWFIDSGVLFININSNELDTDEHAEFIDEVVAEHGDEARWKVLGFHHSIYSTATHNDDADVRRLRKAIPPVAARNDIDLVVSGHDHIYNRTFLMDAEGKPVDGSDAGIAQEKESGQTMYLTLTSSSGSKFYDYVPGLEWEAKSVHNDVPAFTRVRVTDGSLRATTYEVPTGTDGQVTAQAASEEIDDVEITRASDEAPEPDDDADADGAGADADGAGAGAGADGDGAGAGADAAGGESDSGGAGPNRDGTETSADEADTAADADGSTPAAVDAEAEGGEPGAGSESDAASASKDGDDLPRTGTELALPIGLGAGTILLGALLLAASRRRRSALH